MIGEPHPLDLSIPEAAIRLREGRLTALRLAEAHLERIERRNARLFAFTALARDPVLAAAEEADRALAEGRDLGPLHGIPIAVKDLIDTADLRTAYGSRAFDGHVPQADAEVVRRLKANGAVMLGKVATYEFALVGPSRDASDPPAVNPWDSARITGGSSSGSAAAVAGGLARAAIGTDTGGSVRSPAGYCGVVGLKPTFGRVPERGVYPLSPSLDTVGPLAATVEEAALVFSAIADPAPPGWSPPPAEPRTIAYARDWFATDPQADPRIVAAMDDAASALSLAGYRIAEVSLPPYDLFEAAGALILHAEALDVHRALLAEKGELYGRPAFRSLVSGLCVGRRDLALARRAADALTQALEETVFRRFDAMLTVATLTTAPASALFDGEAAVWTPMRTIPFNVSGHPALALPAGFADGLPVGLQIAGRRFGEETICRIGQVFEANTDHATRRPPPPPLPEGYAAAMGEGSEG